MENSIPVKSYRINSTVQNTTDLKDFYQHFQKNIIEIRKHCMIEYRAIKFNLRVYGTYIKQTELLLKQQNILGLCINLYKKIKTLSMN